MKIRKSPGGSIDKVEFNMTPMIDVVFQLLSFFMFTLKIVTLEGDFNIKMPQAAPTVGPTVESLIPPLKVRLVAKPDGSLGSIFLNDRAMSGFDALRSQIIATVGTDHGPEGPAETAEVEPDCYYNLHYQYVIHAISSVSGFISDDGQKTVKLIEKIKFAPPKEEPEK